MQIVSFAVILHALSNIFYGNIRKKNIVNLSSNVLDKSVVKVNTKLFALADDK